MPIEIANPPSAPLSFGDFLGALDALPNNAEGAIDPQDAAPALGALARNRDFLAQAMIAELKAQCATQLSDNRYGPQVVMLHQARGRYAVRANIWPAKDDAEYRANGPQTYFYGRAHDHNFDFLTVGYCGPGYVSDYYDYGEGADNGVLTGYRGEAALGRRAALSALPIVRGPLVINPIDRQVTRAGRPIAMTAREYQLLIYLARRANRYVTTETLRAQVWGQAFDPGTNSVAVHVSRLRQRIDHGFDWAMLRSAKASGYALASTPDAVPIA